VGQNSGAVFKILTAPFFGAPVIGFGPFLKKKKKKKGSFRFWPQGQNKTPPKKGYFCSEMPFLVRAVFLAYFFFLPFCKKTRRGGSFFFFFFFCFKNLLFLTCRFYYRFFFPKNWAKKGKAFFFKKTFRPLFFGF